MSAIACALLGRAADVEPWAAAAALELGREGGVGVVLWWGGREADDAALVVSAPARRAAAATARAAGDLGAAASARGRIVRAVLPETEVAAAATAERVAAALPAPCVLAICGTRGEAFDRLLDATPRVAVAGDPGAPLAALVLDGLTRSGFEPHCLAPAPAGAGLLARAGLVAAAPLRRALGPLLEGAA